MLFAKKNVSRMECWNLTLLDLLFTFLFILSTICENLWVCELGNFIEHHISNISNTSIIIIIYFHLWFHRRIIKFHWNLFLFQSYIQKLLKCMISSLRTNAHVALHDVNKRTIEQYKDFGFKIISSPSSSSASKETVLGIKQCDL